MRKMILAVFAVAIFTFGFTSCKKQWNCSCIDQSDGVLNYTEKTKTIGADNQKEALSKCEDKLKKNANFTCSVEPK